MYSCTVIALTSPSGNALAAEQTRVSEKKDVYIPKVKDNTISDINITLKRK